ncbi:MAG: M3 family metallopeptidase [Myxococcota bacterium]|nr:M3 family metallopeptidase [Myxococcota bacterium]
MERPFLKDEFYISWSTLEARCVEPNILRGIAQAKKSLEELCSVPEPSYENTILVFEEILDTVGVMWRKVTHLNSFCSTPELRAALNSVLPHYSEFMSSIFLNAHLWKQIQRINTQGLSPLALRHINEIRHSFRNNGADLDAEYKERFAEISRTLATKTQRFSENVLDATEDWEHIVEDASLLEGLPASAIEMARQSATAKGHPNAWRFTLQRPSYGPVLLHAKTESFRKTIWEAVTQIGRFGKTDNRPLIVEILSLRKEKARLLGFQNFPDLVLSNRMAGSSKEALRFVEGLHAKIRTTYLQEMNQLEQWKAKRQKEDPRALLPWEIGFWMEKMRAEEYGFDTESIRPYLSIDAVLSGMFDLVREIFGVSVVPLKSQFLSNGETLAEDAIEVWHPSVKAYDIFDEDGSKLGSFYTDWFPREGKRGGAWMEPLLFGRKQHNDRLSPYLGVIAGNLTPPVGQSPALITPREMQTIFHEFGHLLHHILGSVEIPSLNGTNVAWDFVELPSQIMENWCREKDVLQRFAFHHETREVLSEAVIQKMKRARNFMSAYGMMRQLLFAKLDLELHVRNTQWSAENIDTELATVLEEYSYSTSRSFPTLVARFGHLFGSPTGYAGGYYSYKWAEVLDADAYSRFQKEGIFNRETGLDFRKCILSQGNSQEPTVLFKNFMGRDPDPDALLRREGLL